MDGSFVEREIAVSSDGLRLVGTLTLPDPRQHPAPVPAALLLSGSGPLDRNSGHRSLRIGTSRELAAALADVGIGSFRFDKRGVGASEGGDWRTAGFYDGVADAAAALRSLAAQPEVDPRRVAVVGHSEGATVASAVVAGGGAASALVLLAASATRGEELLLWQAARIAATLPAPVKALMRLTRTDLVAKVARNHATIKATTTDLARVDGKTINARWTREFLAHDPVDDLSRIRVPVLAVTGSEDVQVDPEDLERIRAVVPAQVTIRRIEGVSHLLRPVAHGTGLGSYRRQVRRPLDPELLEVVTSWLVSELGQRVLPAGPP